MNLTEQIGKFTVKLENNIVTAHLGSECRYNKDHGDDLDTALRDYDGLCECISTQTGITRTLPPPPDFVGTINWEQVDALIKEAK